MGGGDPESLSKAWIVAQLDVASQPSTHQQTVVIAYEEGATHQRFKWLVCTTSPLSIRLIGSFGPRGRCFHAIRPSYLVS